MHEKHSLVSGLCVSFITCASYLCALADSPLKRLSTPTTRASYLLFAMSEVMTFHTSATSDAKGTRSLGGTMAKLRNCGGTHTSQFLRTVPTYSRRTRLSVLASSPLPSRTRGGSSRNPCPVDHSSERYETFADLQSRFGSEAPAVRLGGHRIPGGGEGNPTQ